MATGSEGIHASYGRIPIRDNGEALREIPPRLPRLMPHPYLLAGAPYAGGSPWRLRTGVIAALERAQADLEQRFPGWQIAIFDAWRPLEVQAYMVWRQFQQEAEQQGEKALLAVNACNTPAELLRRDPILYEKLAECVYRFWGIANPDPLHPPPHSTGAALDCTLLDEAGAAVPMGGPIDDFSDRADPEYFASAPAASAGAQAHQNRLCLRDVLAVQGFVQHPGEWWHFSLGDQLWAWRRGAPHAIYGRVSSPVDAESTAPGQAVPADADCPSLAGDVPPAHRY